MTRSLWLLRHGRTAWNLQGRAQGHADVGLDDHGRAQATEVAPYLATVGFLAIWTSDLARARETAEIVGAACNVVPQADERLREFGVGGRQGLTVAETNERFPHLVPGWELSSPPHGIPGAEPHEQVQARIVPAVRGALDSLPPGGTGLVVSHGAALKVAIGGLLGWAFEATQALEALGNCEVAVIRERPADGRLRLRRYGLSPVARR